MYQRSQQRLLIITATKGEGIAEKCDLGRNRTHGFGIRAGDPQDGGVKYGGVQRVRTEAVGSQFQWVNCGSLDK